MTLRRLRADDVARLQAYRSDPEVGRYQGWEPMTDAEARAMMAGTAAAPCPTLGDWVQIAGLASDTSVRRLVGIADVRNAPSARLLERLGMTLEAEQETTYRGEPCREWRYAMRVESSVALDLTRYGCSVVAIGRRSEGADMRRSVRRAVVVGVALGTLGPAFSGTAFGVVGGSPIPTYQANDRVSVITVANGTVYIGGSFTSVRPAGSGTASTTRNHVAAFDEATGALLPWNPNTSGNVRAIEIVGSTAYLGGSFSTVGGAGRHNLAAVDAGSTGAVQSWNPGASNQVLDMGEINGTLYVGGAFTTVAGVARTRLAAFDTATGALTSWAPSADNLVKALSVTTDGSKVIVGGDFTHVNGTSQSHIAAVSPSTGAPLSWATHVPYSVIDLDADANGVFVAGGGGGGNFAGLNPSTGARQWIGGTNGNVQAIAAVGGVVYVGGHFGNYCGQVAGAHTCATPTPRAKLLAVDEGSGALLPWNPGANSSLGVFALAGAQATGNLFAGGDFTTIGGRSQQRYAEFTP